MKIPDWNDLRYFLALSTSGTLSGAARALGVEHSTVARRIDALEAALGARLFDRFARGWTPTAAGLELLPPARRVEEELHGVLRAASGAGALRGSVRVSAPPALCTYLLAPDLPEMLGHLPQIEVELRAEARLNDLARGEADIVLRYQRPTAPGLVLRRLTDTTYGAYATSAYLRAHAAAEWKFLGYDAALDDTPQQQWLEGYRGERRYRLRSNDLGTLYQAARAGAGIAVLPDYLVGDPRSRLLAVPGANCPVRRRLWLVMHEDIRRAAPVRAVADALAAWFEARQPKASTPIKTTRAAATKPPRIRGPR